MQKFSHSQSPEPNCSIIKKAFQLFGCSGSADDHGFYLFADFACVSRVPLASAQCFFSHCVRVCVGAPRLCWIVLCLLFVSACTSALCL
jgi:hypothetical protein